MRPVEWRGGAARSVRAGREGEGAPRSSGCGRTVGHPALHPARDFPRRPARPGHLARERAVWGKRSTGRRQSPWDTRPAPPGGTQQETYGRPEALTSCGHFLEQKTPLTEHFQTVRITVGDLPPPAPPARRPLHVILVPKAAVSLRFATSQLCDPRQVTAPLWARVSSFEQGRDATVYPED